jgi:MSHA type pilus biogenesis protein MshL
MIYTNQGDRIMKITWPNRSHAYKALGLACLLSILASCSSVPPMKYTQTQIKREITIPEETRQTKHQPFEPLKTPDFVPAGDDPTPLKTRIVTISARNTPLKDVLSIIAEATSLNIVMEKGVDPETPVNLTLKNVSADNALTTILNSVDYFSQSKGNMLYVRAIETRTFELGQVPLTQKYQVDVGGDMLAGATSGTSSGGSGGSSSGVRGSIEHGVKGDENAYKFWEAVEKAINHLLGTSQAGTSSGSSGVTINRLAGAITVSGTKKDVDKVGQYLANLKKFIEKQVLVEAKIIEVQLNNNLKFGIDWSYISGDFFAGTLNMASVVSTSGPTFQLSVTDHRFAPLLQALETQGEVRILSNPRINIMNGQSALLSVGRSTSFISKIETTVNPGTPPITTYTVSTNNILSGTLIGIVPYINEKGEISLTVTPIISNLVELKEKSIGGQVALSLPIVDLRELSTTVKVLDGQTIILGGLISKQEGLTDNQIPFIGNLPLIGNLFKSRDRVESKNELVVLLQPRLIN